MKKINDTCHKTRQVLQKSFKIMRLMVVLILGLSFSAFSTSHAQNEKISFKVEHLPAEVVIHQLKGLTNYRFLYNHEELRRIGKKSLDFKEAPIEDILNELFKGSSLNYRIEDNVIIISPKLNQALQQQDKGVIISGTVTDENNNVLPGVTVLMKGTNTGISTNKDGSFQLKLPFNKTVTLVFTFLGLEQQEYTVSDLEEGEERRNINVVMKEDQVALEEVVITGYGNIRKSSFTGSSTHVSREELLNVTTGNVLSALQVFDPSFRMIKNNEMGSDPNTLPEFYIRGRSGLGGVSELDQLEAVTSEDISTYALVNNPNLPVFMLDGYEVSVETVYDLDINRINSVTILKDAAATAMYGSRASNGVIVIETVAPQPGKLRVNYNFTSSLTAPDLSGYNLMNAHEKMDAEIAAGLISKDNLRGEYSNDYPMRLNDYRNKQNNIMLGVNTYWLSQPLKTEFNHKHGLYVDGGVESIRFGLGLSYSAQSGVMKGSGRNTMSTDFRIDYRMKWIQVTNRASLDKSQSRNSPYGSFSDYSKQQPYLSPTDLTTGEYLKRLPSTYERSEEPNPIYEAKLKNRDKSNYLNFTDNLSINACFNDHLQLKAQIAFSYKDVETEKFTDPNSSLYTSSVPIDERGELVLSGTKTFSWNTNVLLMYNVNYERHYLSLTLGLNMNENKSKFSSSRYRGFPAAHLSEQKYAKMIVRKPTVQDNNTRLVGVFLTGNYSFRDIYMADISIRWDGSSEFGSDNQFAPFWSAGVGVNLHNYDWMKGLNCLDIARIKVNYGVTGKGNFSPFASRHTYQILEDDWHHTGIGGVLTSMGNDKLKWEKARTINVGGDFTLLKRINLSVAYYHKQTVNLISDITIPASSGFTSYKDNLGEVINEGYEFGLTLSVVKEKDWNVDCFFRGSHNRNEIVKISNSLQEYNDRVDEHFGGYDESDSRYSRPVMKYEEGGSLTSIFGMKSLGIAPANGKELYLKRNGNVTYDWLSSEQMIIGDTEPELQGSMGLNMRYKRLSLYTSFTFEWGGDAYNQTLVDNVENVNLWQRNADKRVMNMRWQKPGDVTQLKSIKDRYLVTRSTSRFVQRNNTITFNSLSLSYDVGKDFLKKIGLNNLRCQFSMNDIAVMSSIKQERGLSYPFARTFNLTLNAGF